MTCSEDVLHCSTCPDACHRHIELYLYYFHTGQTHRTLFLLFSYRALFCQYLSHLWHFVNLCQVCCFKSLKKCRNLLHHIDRRSTTILGGFIGVVKA